MQTLHKDSKLLLLKGWHFFQCQMCQSAMPALNKSKCCIHCHSADVQAHCMHCDKQISKSRLSKHHCVTTAFDATIVAMMQHITPSFVDSKYAGHVLTPANGLVINEQINVGAVTTVVSANFNSQPLAIKYAATAGAQSVLCQEASILSAAALCPFIVPVFAAARIGTNVGYVMPLALTSLENVEFPEPANLDIIYFIAHSCAAALAYLHGMQVSHNDVKQENLLVFSDGSVKLCDPGIASILGDPLPQRSSTSSSATAATSSAPAAAPEIRVPGTRPYIAPELEIDHVIKFYFFF